MYLRITYLNGEKHEVDFFGKIFTENSALERPMRGETLVATNGDKYFVKDVFVETEDVIGRTGRPTTEAVWTYQLEKVEGKESTIVQV